MRISEKNLKICQNFTYFCCFSMQERFDIVSKGLKHCLEVYLAEEFIFNGSETCKIGDLIVYTALTAQSAGNAL